MNFFFFNIYLLSFQRRSRKLQLPKVCSKKVPEMTKLTNSTKLFMLLKETGEWQKDLTRSSYWATC